MNRERGFGKFYGSTTVSERGQIVIPAQAREELRLEQGAKLMIFGTPGAKGLILMPAEAVGEFLQRAMDRVAKFQEALADLSQRVEGQE